MQQQCKKYAAFISKNGSPYLRFFDDNKEYRCIAFIGEGDVFSIDLEDHLYKDVLSIFVDNIKDIDSLKEEYPEYFI